MKLVSEILKHPANQSSPVSLLTRAVYWQLYKRLTGRAKDISYHGLTLRCYPDSHSASRAIYFSGLPDYREMRFILDYLRPGDKFIDAGANIGLYTLLALSVVGSTGHVHAFEPNRGTANRLLETLRLNQVNNVTVHQMGLSDAPGTVDFNLTLDECTAHISACSSSSTSGTVIDVARLDEQLDDSQYAMAKFDIEGYEPFAIRGTGRWLRNGNPPVMQIEAAGYSNRYGVSTEEIIAELHRFGYFTAVYCPDTFSLKRTNCPWQIPVDNILAISEKYESFVMQRLSQQQHKMH